MTDNLDRRTSTNLDVLRSMAVLMVLFDHLTRHYHFDRYGDIGFFGVLLFFVHTSLVLMYSMQKSRLKGMALVKDFYIRRFFRIYPLSVLAIFVAVALHLHSNGRGLSFGPRPSVLELISNLFLIQNLTYSDSIIGPLWSLPLEIQMYLVLPFLFLWKNLSFWRLLALWVVCGMLGHFPEAIPSLAWFSLLIFVPNFLPGVMAFTRPHKKFIPSYFWPPFVLLLALIFLWEPSRRMGAELCLLLGVALPSFEEIAFLPLKFVSHHIARYSYGIYLGHSFFIWWALTQHHNWILFWLMWLTIPAILYYAVERPMINLGRRVAARTSKTPEIDVVCDALPAQQTG